MLELEDAQARIVAALPKPVGEPIPINEARDRVLAETISSPVELPLFDNSSVDGFAARAEDVAAAASHAPVRLRLTGKVAAGETFAGVIARGECVRIFTGSPLPRGADAVVMQEDTQSQADCPDEIRVLEPARPWENVRLRGEDVKRGATLAEAGDVLTAGRITLLAAAGLTRVTVGRRPVVGLLATGSELKEAGQPLAPGQIYESNRAGLKALIQKAGGLPKCFPIVPDGFDATCAALTQAFAECDVVVTCGGVSVGEMDFVKDAFERLGGALQFWKVAVKPGKPFVFGRWGEKHLFGLPGNPVSALVTLLMLVRPALLRWQGATALQLPSHPGVLDEPLSNPGERRHFLRVVADTAGKVRSAGVQASHVLSSLAASNGLVDMPPHATFPAGTNVRVLRWE